jgi:hypothetical protein
MIPSGTKLSARVLSGYIISLGHFNSIDIGVHKGLFQKQRQVASHALRVPLSGGVNEENAIQAIHRSHAQEGFGEAG